VVVVNKALTLSSSQRRQLIDITDQVLSFIGASGIRDGICTVSVPHATAAIIVNEHESGLGRDILTKIEDLFPQASRYAHNAIDDNADAHVAAAFLGHSRMFPVAKGRIVRGTWQNVFLVELDGPRSRRDVHLQMLGDS
jgi:secondary thiamine-phosphate synthase enzyme